MINALIAWHIVVMKHQQYLMFLQNPLKAIGVAMNGPKTDGPMAKEIDLSNSRDPEFVFDYTCSKDA